MVTNDMERLISFPVLSILTMVVFFAAECQAKTMTFGPTPYLSEADSPFDLSRLGTTFFLEDFEDGELNTPGASVSSTSNSSVVGHGSVIGNSSSLTDSVDGDDGQIDGDGSLGYSLQMTGAAAFAIDFADAPPLYSTSTSLHLDFDPIFEGRLPNAVGFVLTDSGRLAGITLTAYDAQGDVIAIIIESGLDDGLENGATDEDRFFGVVDTGGIAKISIQSSYVGSSFSRVKFEIDHLQYGIAVPEPATILLLLTGIAGIAAGYRRRRRAK